LGNDGCLDINTHSCGTNQVCSDGSCVCASGYVDCDDDPLILDCQESCDTDCTDADDSEDCCTNENTDTGDETNHWFVEKDDGAQCCGDDDGENPSSEDFGDSMDSSENADSVACCDASDDCVYDSNCYDNEKNTVNVDGDNDNDYCDAGTWVDCTENEQCDEDGGYVCDVSSNDCVKGGGECDTHGDCDDNDIHTTDSCKLGKCEFSMCSTGTLDCDDSPIVTAANQDGCEVTGDCCTADDCEEGEICNDHQCEGVTDTCGDFYYVPESAQTYCQRKLVKDKGISGAFTDCEGEGEYAVFKEDSDLIRYACHDMCYYTEDHEDCDGDNKVTQGCSDTACTGIEREPCPGPSDLNGMYLNCTEKCNSESPNDVCDTECVVAEDCKDNSNIIEESGNLAGCSYVSSGAECDDGAGLCGCGACIPIGEVGWRDCDDDGECETYGECCAASDCPAHEWDPDRITACVEYEEGKTDCVYSPLYECNSSVTCPGPYTCNLDTKRCIMDSCDSNSLDSNEDCDYIEGELNIKSASNLMSEDETLLNYCNPETCELFTPTLSKNLEKYSSLPVLEGDDGFCTKGKKKIFGDGFDPMNECNGGGIADELFYFTPVMHSYDYDEHHMSKDPDIYFNFEDGEFTNVNIKGRYISDEFVLEFTEFVFEETEKDGQEFYNSFGFYPWELYDDIIFSHCDSKGLWDGDIDDDGDESTQIDFYSVMPTLVDKDGKEYNLSTYTELDFSEVDIKFGPGEYNPRCVVARRTKYSEETCDAENEGKKKVDWVSVKDGTPCGNGLVCSAGKCVNLSNQTCGNYKIDGDEECERVGESKWNFTIDGNEETYNAFPDCSVIDSDYNSGKLNCSDTCMIDTSECKTKEGPCGDGNIDKGETCEYNPLLFRSGEHYSSGKCEDYETKVYERVYEGDDVNLETYKNLNIYESGNIKCTEECGLNLEECRDNTKPSDESKYEKGCTDGINNDEYFDYEEYRSCGWRRVTPFNTTRCLNETNCTDCQDKDCNGLVGDDSGNICEFGKETLCDDGFDNDGDGLIDGEDSNDCVGPNGYCGDGNCGCDESHESCPEDCPAPPNTCGDGTCEGDENINNCPEDCATCGDGVCNGDETFDSCPDDCGKPGFRSYNGETGSCSIDLVYQGLLPCYHHVETDCVKSGTVKEGYFCHDGVWYSRLSVGMATLMEYVGQNVKVSCTSSPEEIFNRIDYYSAGGANPRSVLQNCVDSACYLVSENERTILLNVRDYCVQYPGSDFPSYIFGNNGYPDVVGSGFNEFEKTSSSGNAFLYFNNYSKQLIYSTQELNDLSSQFKNDDDVLPVLYIGGQKELENATKISSLLYYNGRGVEITGKKAQNYASSKPFVAVRYDGLADDLKGFLQTLFRDRCENLEEGSCTASSNFFFLSGNPASAFHSVWWPGYTSLLWDKIEK
jgi:hypothetical protein